MIALGVSALPFDDHAGFTAPPAFGPFRVLHQIGSGVLGPVFRTFDPQQEKLVAVKVFRLDVVPEVSARLAEALKRLAAARVEHPAVVRSVDAGLEGTTAFLAMEYVAAETLDVGLRRLAPARLETALPLLRQVAEGIEAAWSVGMGHGALHPRDIFLLPAAGEASQASTEVRVAGFGVTDALEELHIPAPVRRPYTAPEREDGGPWDIRADVYSLGVIAHELLTGRRPVAPVEPEGELPSGASLEETVTIRRALSGALAMDPARRFPTPTAFVDALMTGAVPETAAEAPAAPPPVEPELDVQPEPEPELEPESESELEPEAESESKPDVPAAASPPASPRDASPVMAPSFLGVQSRPDRREPFQVGYDVPKESAMPRAPRVAAMLVIALAVGTGFGYWLRGPAPTAADVTAPPPVTKVPDDEPIGTEVAVKEPAVAAPVSPAKPVAAATTGSMLVETRPTGATVSIDGRAVGRAPMRVPKLSPGSHRVRLALAGYKTMTTTVVVRAGQQTTVRVSLEIQ